MQNAKCPARSAKCKMQNVNQKTNKFHLAQLLFINMFTPSFSPLKTFASKAYTMAEALIAMCIVGIIIEVTVPNLIYAHQKQVIMFKVKATYSMLEQATKLIAYDCGGDLANCLTNPRASDNDNATRTELTNLYKAKFAVLKDCTTGTTSGCFANTTYNYLDFSPDDNFETRSYYDKARVVFRNGVAVGFDWDGPTAFPPYYYVIPVDINNSQGPNQVGKDTFFFYYDTNQKCVKPWPIPDCGIGTKQGTGCAQRIITENAINYY